MQEMQDESVWAISINKYVSMYICAVYACDAWMCNACMSAVCMCAYFTPPFRKNTNIS